MAMKTTGLARDSTGSLGGGGGDGAGSCWFCGDRLSCWQHECKRRRPIALAQYYNIQRRQPASERWRGCNRGGQ